MGVLGNVEITDAEQFALMLVISHHCECPPTMPDVICMSHLMLENDRLLKHLLFVRRDPAAYIHAEWYLDND